MAAVSAPSALRASASANAFARGGSLEDAQSNARLGAILRDLRE